MGAFSGIGLPGCTVFKGLIGGLEIPPAGGAAGISGRAGCSQGLGAVDPPSADWMGGGVDCSVVDGEFGSWGEAKGFCAGESVGLKAVFKGSGTELAAGLAPKPGCSGLGGKEATDSGEGKGVAAGGF